MKNTPQRKNPNPSPQNPIRLNRLLAQYGLCSRRKADEWIAEGRVSVDGKVCRELGTTVDPQKQRITVDGKPLIRPPQRYYLALHKPRGVITTRQDPQGRPTVMELLPQRLKKLGLFPIGRLDTNSEGLLLMSNDGDWGQILLHPSHQVWKTYRVKTDQPITDDMLTQLQNGVELDGEPTLPAQVSREIRSDGAEDRFRIAIREGRRRQIRRMCEALGLRVTRLIRVAVGPIELGRLPLGEWRELTKNEVDEIKKLATLKKRKPKPES